jgi:hypothetical protein
MKCIASTVNKKSKSAFSNSKKPELASYFFVKPKEASYSKEKSISQFLCANGVFQIHLKMAMDEFQPTPK